VVLSAGITPWKRKSPSYPDDGNRQPNRKGCRENPAALFIQCFRDARGRRGARAKRRQGEKATPARAEDEARINGQIAKAKAKVDRYFEAFGAGTMKPDLCNQKVKDLAATLEALKIERRELAARRSRLTIPPVDKEILEGILSEFDETMANGTNPQKKAPSPPGGEEGAYS